MSKKNSRLRLLYNKHGEKSQRAIDQIFSASNEPFTILLIIPIFLKMGPQHANNATHIAQQTIVNNHAHHLVQQQQQQQQQLKKKPKNKVKKKLDLANIMKLSGIGNTFGHFNSLKIYF